MLAKKSGISDRVIGMYRNRESIPSIDKAERIAKALGFELWQMQMPDFQPDLIKNRKLKQIYYAYTKADDNGRKIMEAQAEYITSMSKNPANDKHPSAPKKKSGN